MTPTTLADLISARIRLLREDRGWTGAELAARCRAHGLTRWSPNTVAKVETGRQRADHLADLFTLCEVFDLSLTDLLTGDGDVVLDGTDTVKSLLAVRMALVGLNPPSDPDLAVVDEYNLDRIAVLAGLEHEGQLRMVTYALYDRQSILEVRDERAGIMIRPGTRANISARRGNATKRLLTEIAVAVEQFGLQALLDKAMAKYEAAAIDITGDDGA